MRTFRAVSSCAVVVVLVGCGAEDAPATPEPAAETSVIDSTPADTTTTPDTATTDSATPDTTTDTTTADTTTTETAVVDSMIVDTAVAETASDAGCAGPSVKFQHSGIAASDKPLTPITVTGSVCPSSTATFTPAKTTGMGGVPGSHNVPDKIDLWFHATQTGSLPAFSPAFHTDSAHPAYKLTGTFGAQWIVFATDYPFATAFDPAWNVATKGLIHIETTKGTPAAGACTTTSGITYSVTGHPEAVVKYEGSGTSTSTQGRADITIVTTGTATAPEMVTIVGTKAGCTVNFVGGGGFLIPQTGKMPVAAGHTTGTVLSELKN